MSTPFIDLLPPPGPSVYQSPRAPPFTPSAAPGVPPIFLSALSVRFPVFVDEQKCSRDEEIDKDDPSSWHWVVYVSVGGKGTHNDADGKVAAGAIRLVPVTPLHVHSEAELLEKAAGPKYVKTELWDGKESFVKLGRMATLKEYRKLGLGRLLVNTAIEWLKQNADQVDGEKSPEDAVAKEKEDVREWRGLVLLHAQKDIERFWQSCGFEKDEGMGEWCEEGIEHIAMWRRVNIKRTI